VRGALPGEQVRARPVARRGEGWAATTEAVLAPSAERIAPPCPHFGTCGGCALQHWQEDAYLAWKSGLLEVALRRAGYDAPALAPITCTPPRARRRMDLAVRRVGHAVRLGLHEAGGREVVDLRCCEVLHPALAALLDPLRAVLAELAALRREGSVAANLLREGPDLLLRTDAELSATDRARLAGFAQAHRLPRIAWARGAAAPEVAAQHGSATIAFHGVTVAPPPGAFLQASEAGEAAIVAVVLAGLPERLPARAHIAELYAGCGTLSFALAARARVAAFEGDAAACAALSAAANHSGLAGRITIAQRDLARRPLSAAELAGFATLVLDPPHAGAAAQMPPIIAARVPRVIYVSCNPAALARDAAMLRAGGYALVSATPIDQFRWSARLESVAVFRSVSG
jgi:23S rRNA (uracil1939-C5)-methyltransferase